MFSSGILLTVTIAEKIQSKFLCLFEKHKLVGSIHCFLVQVQQWPPQPSFAWGKQVISNKMGNFDKLNKPWQLNYPVWDVLRMEKGCNGKLKG
jgi:hypothetical protein